MSDKNRKIALVIGAIAIVLAIAAFVVFILPGLRPTIIAYYGIDEVSYNSIKALFSSGPEGEPPLDGLAGFEHVILDPSKPLSEHLSSGAALDLLIAFEGRDLSSIAGRFTKPSDQAARRLPSSLRALGLSEGGRYGIALQADTLELAYSRALFASKGLAAPTSLAGLLSAMRALKSSDGFPLLLAGGSDDDLLLLVSALVEMRGGTRASEALRLKLASTDFSDAEFREALDAELPGSSGADFSLKTILEELATWKRDGLIHPEWYAFKERDLIATLESGYAPIVIMRLSSHRKVSLRRIAQYEAASLPYPQPPTAYRHAALALVGAVNARSPASKVSEAEKALDLLTGNEAQRRLSWTTGLVPSNAAIEALDKQAADARLWLAASGGVLVDMGRASLSSPSDRAALAKALRDAIRVM